MCETMEGANTNIFKYFNELNQEKISKKKSFSKERNPIQTYLNCIGRR